MPWGATTRQPRFVHAGHVAYPTQRAHATIVFDALDSNSFVKLIGGNSVVPNLVHSDAAHFPEPSMVPAGQSTDKVCSEAPRLAAENDVPRVLTEDLHCYGFKDSSLW